MLMFAYCPGVLLKLRLELVNVLKQILEVDFVNLGLSGGLSGRLGNYFEPLARPG